MCSISVVFVGKSVGWFLAYTINNGDSIRVKTLITLQTAQFNIVTDAEQFGGTGATITDIDTSVIYEGNHVIIAFVADKLSLSRVFYILFNIDGTCSTSSCPKILVASTSSFYYAHVRVTHLYRNVLHIR